MQQLNVLMFQRTYCLHLHCDLTGSGGCQKGAGGGQCVGCLGRCDGVCQAQLAWGKRRQDCHLFLPFCSCNWPHWPLLHNGIQNIHSESTMIRFHYYCTGEKPKVVSICTVHVYSGMEVQHRSLLTSVLGGGEWSTLRFSHINLWKDLQYLLNRRLGGPQTWCGHFGKEKNLLLLPGVELWIS